MFIVHNGLGCSCQLLLSVLQMSYNNYLDGDAAYTAVCDFPEPSCVIVKHTNPCGAASRADLKEAYPLAVRADPTSAFGGIVAFNRYVQQKAVWELLCHWRCIVGTACCSASNGHDEWSNGH